MPALASLLARDIARLENAGATIPAERTAVSERLAVLRQAAKVITLATDLVAAVSDRDIDDVVAASELLKEALASDVVVE